MQEETTMLSLKWDSFSSQMTNSLDVCYEKQYFVDLSLVCKNGTIVKCHKMVLANASSFFRRLLVKNDHPHPMIILHDIEPEDLKIVVNFMYTGEIQVSKSKVRRILQIGEILEVSGLKDIRGTILTSDNDKTINEDPGPSINTENSIKIVETKSLVKKNTRIETPVSTIPRRITRSFRKSREQNNESGEEIENNTKFRGTSSKKHGNNGNHIERSRRSVNSINNKPEVAEKVGKFGKKRAQSDKEISWTKVLSQISKENEGFPLKKLCLMEEIEITKSEPMKNPISTFDRLPENSEATINLSGVEHYVNCGIVIKDEVDSPESDYEFNDLPMENDEHSEHERLMNNSAIDVFRSLDLTETLDKNDSCSFNG